MSITWVTKDDDNVCPICVPLHGNIWLYDTEKEAFPTVISSPTNNFPVWDAVRDKSLTHLQLRNQGRGIPCRCVLSVDFDFTDLTAHLKHLRRQALETLGSIETWKTGRVMVLRHEGRFVSWRKA